MSPLERSFLFITVVASLLSARITVPDNHPTIQSAIENAQEGDTVFVKIGVYKESITLRNDMALVGESMTATIISGSKKGPAVKGADNTLIRNCTVQNGTVGILAENSSMTIDQVIVRNNSETGIHCLIALPDIYNCIISGNGWSGIYCESTRSIKTSIMHNIIAENGYNGITLEGVSEVLIMNNVIFSNRQYGIWGKEETRKSRIIYNDFYGNRSSVNLYLKRDMSNITDNPEFPYSNGVYDYLSTSNIMLKGKGKDGATIGLINSEVLTQKRTDPDEDGVILDNDKCPSIPEDLDGFEDEDGCPDFDNDKDGFFDTEDACPNSPEDFDGFRDDDGCLDDDNDKDGIPDSVDVCKNNAEVYNNYKDEDGCPDEIPPVKETENHPAEINTTPPDSSGTSKR